MDSILIDADALAKFSNLKPQDTEEFRNKIYRDFLPADLWDVLSFTVGDTSVGETSSPVAWQSIQGLLQDAWANRFPLDSSVQIITAVDKLSQLTRQLARASQMSNEDIVNRVWPAQEVWPFQRAVMFLAVESWRARFCPACGKRFVAVKPKSTYCDVSCFKEARKGAKRAWWNAHGQQLRNSKPATSQAKKLKKG
jgi:hypothetical protein